MASWELTDELNCSICLNTYNNPVTLRCGHSFCQGCIEGVLKTQEEKDVYTCPNCRKRFMNPPVLQKNVTLCNITERYQSAASYQPRQGVFCTYCIHSTVPALQHCQLCEASLCTDHLRVHCKSLEHTLYDLSPSVGVPTCPEHRQALEYYCTEHALCVCAACGTSEEHQGHHLAPIPEALEKKKQDLQKFLRTLVTKNNETENKLETLRENLSSVHGKFSLLHKRVVGLLRDLRRQMSSLEMEVQHDISKRREKATQPLSDHIDRLQKHQYNLVSTRRRIKELCNMDDAITVLQEKDSAIQCDPDDEPASEGGEVDEDSISMNLYSTLFEMVTGIDKWFTVQPPVKLVLDSNTAANDVHVSSRVNSACWSERNLNRPDNPERFQGRQVITSSGVSSGRHYWDVQAGGCTWRIGVCYPSIERSGESSYIGNNVQSWCICTRSENQNFVMHDGKDILLPHQFSSQKLRIWLDYDAGKLSFFDLSGKVRHLYTFTANFTEPLYAAFYLWRTTLCKDWVKIVD